MIANRISVRLGTFHHIFLRGKVSLPFALIVDCYLHLSELKYQLRPYYTPPPSVTTKIDGTSEAAELFFTLSFI